MANFSFYLADFPDGGTGTAVLHTAERLINNGHKIIVYTPRHHQNSYPLDCRPDITVVDVPQSSPSETAHLDFLCQHIIDHAVSVMVVVAMRSFPFEEIKRRTSCKMVYALHGKPFYEEHDITLRKQMGAKNSWGLWLSYWFIQHWRIKWLHRSRQKVLPFYRSTIAACDKFVVLCDEYVDSIIKELKLSEDETKKICAIPNGIIRKEVPVLKKEKMILFVGRLTYEDKRPMRMVEIWSRIYNELPDWRFLIVGDGPERQTIEDAVRQRGIERMELVGFSNNVVSYYQKASIVCLTSQYEGWPLCLAEGQSYGVVPIAFNCSAGVRDIISQPGIDGVLVPPYDCRMYAKRLLQLASDDDTLSMMRTYVIEKAKEYTMDRNSEGYLHLLEEMIK